MMDELFQPMDLIPGGGRWYLCWAYPDDQADVVMAWTEVIAFAVVAGHPELAPMVSIGGRNPTFFENTRLGANPRVVRRLIQWTGLPSSEKAAAVMFRQAQIMEPPWPPSALEWLSDLAGDELLYV